MSVPHDRINFNLRPNKRIERKLIAEALTCIYRYDNPRRFGYVGMGSYYFSDFIVFHRLFGIDNMVSIEADIGNIDRFHFNKPFDCIEMQFGTTHDLLSGLPIFDQSPVICWLDYYSYLTDAVLGDIQTVLTRATRGSALVITLQADGFKGPEHVDKFFSNLPEELDSIENKRRLSRANGVHEFMLEVIQSKIDSTIRDINVGSVDPIIPKPIINIAYKDGVKMATFGWLLLNQGQLDKLNVIPQALDAPGISVPNILDITAPTLTFKEITHLKTILPNGVAGADFEQRAKPIKKDPALQFAKFYRYFPSFADVEE